jgi:hypothetical protein
MSDGAHPAAASTSWQWWARHPKVGSTDQGNTRSEQPSTAGLLARRMRGLHLDPERFASSEESAFAELARLCARCESGGHCGRGLDDEFADLGWQAWRDYCPNATTLSVLTALQGCESAVADARLR